jgi:hypothetical protein
MTKWAKVEYGEGFIEALAAIGIDAEKEVNRALAKDRFIQLAEQAGFIPDNAPGMNSVLEKFAELIVKECANVIAPMDDWCGGHGEPSMPSTGDCAKRLKEHFGVK